MKCGYLLIQPGDSGEQPKPVPPASQPPKSRPQRPTKKMLLLIGSIVLLIAILGLGIFAVIKHTANTGKAASADNGTEIVADSGAETEANVGAGGTASGDKTGNAAENEADSGAETAADTGTEASADSGAETAADSETEEEEEKEFYFPVDEVYTSKWGDEEEETTRDKYTYYFDGLTVYSFKSNNTFEIKVYREDGALKSSKYYHLYKDDDITHSTSNYEYNEAGQCIKYEYTYDNVYGGKHHRRTESKWYAYNKDDSDGRVVLIKKTDYDDKPIEVTFVLDADNRIVKETEKGAEKTEVYLYQYDKEGNRVATIPA
ncbi:MAG: hypothetical protein Q4B22_09465 [Eubacteriales bacterium]|nr:hypothetical protein [Eubacteriales bacterium]